MRNVQMPALPVAPKLCLTALAAVALSACSGSSPLRFETGLTAEQRAVAARIPVREDAFPEDAFGQAKPVEGLSCRITAADDYKVSREDAIEELQRAAFKAAASAVFEVKCERMRFPEAPSGCAEAILCRGLGGKQPR
jgi:hypothetical protein